MEMNKFSAVMSEKDEMELIRIITSERANYQPEAVFAAEAELKKRNISPSMYQGLVEKVEKLVETEKGIKTERQHLPLSTWMKVTAFIFPFPILFIIGLLLVPFGYQARGKALTQWTFLGWLFYFILIMFVELFL